MTISNAAFLAKVTLQLTKAADLGTISVPLLWDLSKTFAVGTALGQVDKAYADRIIAPLGSNIVLDMGTGGGMVDVFGDAFEMAAGEVVLVAMRGVDAGAHDVTVGANATEPFLGPLGGTTPTTVLKAGGGGAIWYNPAGWAITNNSNDKLKFANAGGADVNVDVVILGRSA